jgi:hypothetical protein|tara:strand:+ start:240 stop:428 length:189 start_codon:yes stop_codon:yes gene_type:complete
MSLFSKGVYPELSYEERNNNSVFARTYDALINILRLRDASEGEIPVKIADQDQQRSMNWFLN